MKTLQFLLMLTAIGFSMISCDSSAERPQFELDLPDEIPDDNYLIYSAVFDEMYESDKIVIAQSSQTNLWLEKDNSFHEMLLKNNPGFDSYLLTDLAYQNSESLLFENKFLNHNQEFALITSDELKYIFNGQDINDSWNEYYKSHDSNGYMRLTQIGFNKNKTQAVFEFSHHYASLGAGGFIIYLVKEDCSWLIKDIVYTWVS
ncbi:hypothetical protein [Carboxylicivirga sp. RSCT41]|uniref:hypothetical protein n=1 Tax=Carboxylicivirga agarovorans TaxID=3417570 RepID=UPI003D34D19C